MKLYLKIILLTLVNCLSSFSQPPYAITQYNIEDGLPQQTITAITKDREGYMWFTTWNGICKFDGHTFITYRVMPRDSNDLATNRIDDIKIDAHNNLWLSDDVNAIYRFSPQNSKFTRLTFQTAPAKRLFTLPDGDTWLFQSDGRLLRISPTVQGLSSQQILDSTYQISNVITLVSEKDVIWIITDKGVYSFQKKSNKLILNLSSKQSFYSFRKWMNKFIIGSDNGLLYIFDYKKNSYSILRLNTSNKLRRIKAYDANHLLIITENDGFFLTDIFQGEGTHYTASEQLLSNQVHTLYDDNKQKNIWVAYKNTAMITRIAPFTNYCKHYRLKTQEHNNAQRYISQDHNDRLWVFSKNEVLNYYDEKADEFLSFSINRTNCKTKFPKTKKIYFDRQDNLWIANSPKGLMKVSFKKDLFTLSTPNVDKYTINQELRSILEDANHNIWVGTKNGEIQLYDANKNFIGFLDVTGKISQKATNFDSIYALLQDKNGCIWIGTRNEGIIKLIPQDTLSYQLNYYKYNQADVFSLNCNSIFSLQEDKQGRIVVGTLGGGINYIEKDENGNERFIHSGNKLSDYPSRFSRIKNICIDHENNIWLATTAGILLCKWDQNKDKLTYTCIVRNSNLKTSLSCNNVYDIFENSKQEIFVVTFGGGLDKLIGFDEHNNGIFKNYSSPRMISNVPLTLSEDNEESLWISSENGLYRLFTDNDSIEIYDNRFLPEDILLTDCRAYRLSNNDILFGTDKGLLSLTPEKMKRDTYKPNLDITDILVNGEKHLSPHHLNHITLDHNENSFSINYQALDMRFPNKIGYAYRLKGFDNWNYVNNNRTAIYTNIPKGKYIFQIQSTNSEWIWNDKIKEIPITILPSFWESTYGIIFYIFTFILIVSTSAYILFTIYKLRNRVTVEKQILNIKTKFFTDIIHELRTPFTLIVAPIDHILAQKEISPIIQQDLELVKRNTKHTLKIINQVLDLQKIQNESKLTVQRIKIEPFITHIIDSFQPIAIQRESEIIFQTYGSPILLWADPDKLESILFNLITNAFKYSPKGTVIQLSAQETDSYIILQIADQGYGISQEKQKNIFNRFENYVSSDIFKQQSTGIGLSLVKEQVELHKGKISLQSKINEGSIFTIQFRKGKEHFDLNTEFILTDSDEYSPLYTKDTLFSRNDNEVDGEEDSNKSSILVVDDNRELLSFLYIILSEEFRVITAPNGKEGLEKASKYLPCMIISDIIMPEMTGIEMVKKLQSSTSTCHIPIILLSSKAEVEDQNQGLNLGVDDYIIKPFSASYLIAKIENIIKQRKRLQALYYSALIQKEEGGKTGSEAKEKFELLPKSDKELLDKIVNFIKEHLDDTDLTVDTLIDTAGISRSALFKKIKMLVGISPMELIKNIRLEKAAELIKEGSDNFTQIAYRTGFNDSQYFSKCFKQSYGMTPTEFKKKNL